MEYKLASSTWDEKELDSIQKVINSGNFSMGNEVAKYEKDFAKFFNSKFSVMVSSGSAANLLMVAALFFTNDSKKRLKRGDEVIVPAVSWSTTYFPLQQYGLKVKFVDIDIDTLNFDLTALESAISNKTKVILAVNLLGNSNNFKRINSLIKDKDITLIEDNCESMGAKFEQKYTGTFGLMGTFSSFYSHHITTMEGGCIVTDDEELYHILLCIRAHGWTRNLPDKNHVTGLKSKDPFEESFKFVLPGYNVRPLEISGAIGQEQLKKLPNFLSVRRKNAEIFNELFHDSDIFKIQTEIGNSSWFGFSLIIKKEVDVKRSDVISALYEHNIDCRPIVTGNFLKNTSVLEHFDYQVHGNLHNSELLDKNGFFIGNHQVDLVREIKYLYEVLS